MNRLQLKRRLIVSAGLAIVAAMLLSPGCESPPPPEGKTIGNMCPEIVGTDADGKTIRLSEYRGKVVLISFWGTWCPPCRALLPEERTKMQTDFAGRPFTILGVAADPPDRLKEFLKDSYLPWPNIADGSPPGPIVKEWKVDRFPSVMLIDHSGIIVNKWFGGAEPGDVWLQVERAVREAQR
jgi:peroxiredoxin